MLAELTQEKLLPAGFTTRPATMADLETAVALMNDCSEAQVGRREHNIDNVRVEWLTEKFNVSQNTHLVFSPEDEMVGYVEVWDTHPLPVSIWVWARVHPDYEGMGIGTYLQTWAEDRCRQAFDRVPADARVVMRSSCISTHEPTKRFLRQYGMTPVRYFWTMRIDLDEMPPAPMLPDGITIKTFAEADDLTAVVRAIDEAFQDHWGYVKQPFAETLKEMQDWIEKDDKFDPALWFLAMAGDEIAGFSLCRSESWHDPEWGWVDELGVRRPWRRQGIALALLHHSFAEFYKRGNETVGLGVDAASLTGATRLYEKAGMHVFREFQNFEKELRSGRDLTTRTLED